jgi:hypothetical protein
MDGASFEFHDSYREKSRSAFELKGIGQKEVNGVNFWSDCSLKSTQ